MWLKFLLSTSLISVIHGHVNVPIDSQILPSLQWSQNINTSPGKDYKPESTFNFFKMQKADMNCFVNINNQNDEFFLLSFDSEYEPIARHRRTIHGWQITKPLYVDEPKWIVIEDLNYPKIDQRNYINNKVDPFYITRGKRITMDHMKSYVREQESNLPHMNGNSVFVNSKNSVSSDTNSQMYHELNRADLDATIQNNNRHLRDKHSDIMNMLLEPFVISRGKKNLNEQEEDTHILNAQKFIDDTSSRNRRSELFDQLMKEKDPFYVARGKRHSQL